MDRAPNLLFCRCEEIIHFRKDSSSRSFGGDDLCAGKVCGVGLRGLLACIGPAVRKEPVAFGKDAFGSGLFHAEKRKLYAAVAALLQKVGMVVEILAFAVFENQDAPFS